MYAKNISLIQKLLVHSGMFNARTFCHKKTLSVTFSYAALVSSDSMWSCERAVKKNKCWRFWAENVTKPRIPRSLNLNPRELDTFRVNTHGAQYVHADFITISSVVSDHCKKQREHVKVTNREIRWPYRNFFMDDITRSTHVLHTGGWLLLHPRPASHVLISHLLGVTWHQIQSWSRFCEQWRMGASCKILFSNVISRKEWHNRARLRNCSHG